MAKIVVTGGQGFLGRNLTERLVQNENDVCSTYSYNPPHHKSNKFLSHFKLDVTRFEDCLKLVNQENPDIVYHFVAQPLVTVAQRHPFSTLELTIRGAYNLLEAIRQSGGNTKVVMYTSDKVYGETKDAKEGDRIDTVSTPYEVAKVCEDLLSTAYAKSYGLPIVIMRSANVYGRYDLHWDRIIPYLCKCAVEGKSPYLRTSGLQYRDYLYVDDVLDAMEMVGEMLLDDELDSGTVINLGADKPHTTLDITEKVFNVANKEHIKPIIMNTAQGELSYQHINYDYAKSLGWSPKTPIDLGLEKTYQWYKEWFQ